MRKIILIIAAASGILLGCSKGGIKPVLTVNNLSTNAAAGDQVQFDINASGTNALTRLVVMANYNNGGDKTITDTTYAKSPKILQYEYYYTIPPDAQKNQAIAMTFTLYDAKGGSTTASRTITVKGAQPVITFTSSATSGAPGAAISLHVNVTSASNDLGTVEISQGFNGTLTTLDTKQFQNQNNVSVDYVYNIPTAAHSGDKISLGVVATNNDNIQRRKDITITVQ